MEEETRKKIGRPAKIGRPKKDLDKKKYRHKSIRLDCNTEDKLNYICRVTGKNESQIIRDTINSAFFEEIHK